MSIRDRHVAAHRRQVEQSAGELMSVDEAIERFRDEWVLMRVIEYDEHHWPAKGYVLAHSRDEAQVTAALAGESSPAAPSSGERTEPYYVFNAYPRVRSGPDYVAAASRFVADFITQKAAYDARKRR
jgi:hypothetical protein